VRALLIFVLAALQAVAASVTTAQYSNSRTNANTAETVLTPRLVEHHLVYQGSWTITGQVYAQPLIVEGVSIGGATRVLVVATMHNVIYCFNADSPGSAALWSTSVGTPRTDYTPQISPTPDEEPEIGCKATPVIDASAGIVYAVCTLSDKTIKLFSLNLSDGSTHTTAVTIAGSYGGVTFVGQDHRVRAALTLANGRVYSAYAAFWNDTAPYQGWVFVHNATTLALVGAWATTPNVNGGGGIWMTGGGLVVDADGNVYGITGNSLTESPNGTTIFNQSFFKLTSVGVFSDYMTPANAGTVLNTEDRDLGSGRILLVGNFVMGGGKDERWWVLNKGALGSEQDTGPGIAQVWTVGPDFPGGVASGTFGGVAFGNNSLYLGQRGQPLKRFAWNVSTFNTTAAATSVEETDGNFTDYTLAYSSNGSDTTTGIIWAVVSLGNAATVPLPGRLIAYDSLTLRKLWTSADALGNWAKGSNPTVSSGKVYVATFDNLVKVYGLASGTSVVSGNVTISGNVEIR